MSFEAKTSAREPGHPRIHDHTTLRCPDHRRRPVRHRHRLPGDQPAPRQVPRRPGAPRAARRHLGPVPLPGHPLGLRHVHLRLRVPAVARPQGAGRRCVDPAVHRGHRDRVRHRREDPLRPEDRLRRLVQPREPLDRHRTPRGHRRDPHLHLRLPDQLHRLLQLRRRLPAGLPRRRPLRGPGHPPAALARGPRLHRQEGRRDRQWRHRRDPGADDGRRRPSTSRCCSARRRTSSRCRRSTRSPQVLGRVLPAKQVYAFARWRNIAIQRGLYLACRRWPRTMRSFLLGQVKRKVGPDGRHEPLHAVVHAVGRAPVRRARRRPVQGAEVG